jgi:2-polyprenyl-3-methyl-5-hydroxy-6-metoxy-1,4-benzoquinol methylase
VFEILRVEYPSFSKTENYIKINFDELYLKEFEELICYFVRDAIDEQDFHRIIRSKIESFIRYSHEFTVLQLKLNKSKSYQYNSFEEVKSAVYNNPMMNDYYLDGLALSQYLWPNHYKMNRFLINGIARLYSLGNVLDAPCGPGIQSWLVRRHSNIRSMTLCDLSLFSVDYSRKLHSSSNLAGTFRCLHSGIEECKGEFDFIINGELLEHLEDPISMLESLDRLLKNDGIIYLTTAIFAAAIDHIYMFRSAREVREMLETHFVVKSELVLPVSLSPYREDMYDEPINYACFLKRR